MPTLDRLLFLSALVICSPFVGEAQIQPFSYFEGKRLPVVAFKNDEVFILEQGKHRRTYGRGIEMDPAKEFGPGFVRIENIMVDLDPLRDAPAKERARPTATHFRFEADLIAEDEIKDAFAVLALVINGSVGNHLVPVGNLSSGRTRRIKVELSARIESVGRLHLFATGGEIRTTQSPEPYQARSYYASLLQGSRGVSAMELCRTESLSPHVLSQDGNRLATVRHRDTHYSLLVYDLVAMKLIRDHKLGDKGEYARDPTWVSDHEIAFVSDRKLLLLDVDSGAVDTLHKDVDEIMTTVRNQPDVLVVVRDEGWFEPTWTARFNVRTKKLYQENRLEEGSTFFDDDGEERIRFERSDRSRRVFYKRQPREGWRPLDKDVKSAGLKFDVLSSNALDAQCEVHSIGPDGDTLYISTRLNSDRFELAAYSMSRGELIRTIAQDPRFDLSMSNSRLLFHKGTSELIGIDYQAEKPVVKWFDETFATIQRGIDKTFPEHVNRPLDWSRDGRTFIYFSFSDRDPGTYYVFRPFESRLIPLLVLGENLKKKPLGRTEWLEFTARDGATVYGYVTYPPEAGTGPAPLVVDVHGGPTVRDTWGFNATNQFLATRGYVVLQVNYRGSSGFGYSYQTSGLYKRIDTVILDDIADGVQHLIKTGIADPNRVAIMGGSFGGWATYMSLIKYPDIYKAGVPIAAVSHWRKLVKDSRRYSYTDYAYNYWRSLLDAENFKETERFIDPYLRVGELKQPVYIMHGERDFVVHPTEAKLMLDALKKTNPHVQAKSFPAASHTYWPYATRITQLNEIEAFLRQHLPAAEVASSLASAVTEKDSE